MQSKLLVIVASLVIVHITIFVIANAVLKQYVHKVARGRLFYSTVLHGCPPSKAKMHPTFTLAQTVEVNRM